MYIEILRGTVCEGERLEPGAVTQTGSSLLIKMGKAKESTKDAFDAYQKKAKEAPKNRKIDDKELNKR